MRCATATMQTSVAISRRRAPASSPRLACRAARRSPRSLRRTWPSRAGACGWRWKSTRRRDTAENAADIAAETGPPHSLAHRPSGAAPPPRPRARPPRDGRSEGRRRQGAWQRLAAAAATAAAPAEEAAARQQQARRDRRLCRPACRWAAGAAAARPAGAASRRAGGGRERRLCRGGRAVGGGGRQRGVRLRRGRESPLPLGRVRPMRQVAAAARRAVRQAPHQAGHCGSHFIRSFDRSLVARQAPHHLVLLDAPGPGEAAVRDAGGGGEVQPRSSRDLGCYLAEMWSEIRPGGRWSVSKQIGS